MSEPTTAELVERVRGEIERNRHCDCPRGMVYHAGNCPFHPDAYNGHAALNALVARVEGYEEALREIQALQPERVQWFRDNGIVFHHAPLQSPPESDGERWEQIAFAIYIDLCEAESAARIALADSEGET